MRWCKKQSMYLTDYISNALFYKKKKKGQAPKKNKNPKDGLFAMYWPLRVNQITVFNFQHAALVSDMQSIPKKTPNS